MGIALVVDVDVDQDMDIDIDINIDLCANQNVDRGGTTRTTSTWTSMRTFAQHDDQHTVLDLDLDVQQEVNQDHKLDRD